MKFNPHFVQAYRPDQVPEIARFCDENVFQQAHDRPARGIAKTAEVKLLQWSTVKHILDWSQQ